MFCYHGYAWCVLLCVTWYSHIQAEWTDHRGVASKRLKNPKSFKHAQYRTSYSDKSFLRNGNQGGGRYDNKIYANNDLNNSVKRGRFASKRRDRSRRHQGYRAGSPWQPYGRAHESSRSNNVPSNDDRERPRVAEHDIRPEDRANAKRKNKRFRSEKPNIVVILTDDQDSELGSLKVMRKTLRILRDGGVTFKNSFVSTPMCCPSRSSFLTGMYVHNHNVYTNNDNCSSLQWQRTHETRNFGAYLSNAGYRTGYFGKYLNEYNGSYIPPGWREWVGLIRNSRFYNYSVNFNGEKIRHGDNYYKDYFTDLIANDSVTFLKQSKQYFPNRPIAMVLSVPAPHGPEDSAPQYQHMFPNDTSHHTPSWNHAPNPDHQWILANTGKMEPIHIAFTDILQRKRLQTLLSVDDLVQKVFTELRNLGEIDNTYVVFTSDHGYHLGQFGLLKGKAMPYDFDVRVPLLIRGPGLKHGVTIENMVQNIDIAPTILDIAGIPVPEHMDGRSFLPLLDLARDDANIINGKVKKKKAWRDTVLLERGKLTKKNLKIREKLEQKQMNKMSRERELEERCRQDEFLGPCKTGQKWECRRNELGRLRMYKCRTPKRSPNDVTSGSVNPATYDGSCVCENGKIGRREKRIAGQRRLKRQLRQDDNTVPVGDVTVPFDDVTVPFDDVTVPFDDVTVPVDDVTVPVDDVTSGNGRVMTALREDGGAPQKPEIRTSWLRAEPVEDAIMVNVKNEPGEKVLRKCRVLSNNTVVCEREVYSDFTEWRNHKTELNKIIQNYRQKLEELRGLRRYLRKQKPADRSSVTTMEPASTPNPLSTVNPFIKPTSTESSWEEPRFDWHCVCGDDVTTPLPPVTDVDGDDAGAGAGLDHDYSKDEEDTDNADLDYSDDKNSPRIYIRLKRLMRRYRDNPEDADLREKIEQVNRRLKKKQKKARQKQKQDSATKKCKSSRMKCFLHDNDHWKTKPLWTSPRRDPACTIWGMECHRMDNAHWKTQPKWTYGPFCFCPNSANNTYWCLRTINDTHNFLYCEFITGFLSYYDMTTDPWQLRNAIHDLHYTKVHQLHERLEKMKKCRGARECTHRTRGGMEVPQVPPNSRKSTVVVTTIVTKLPDTKPRTEIPLKKPLTDLPGNLETEENAFSKLGTETETDGSGQIAFDEFLTSNEPLKVNTRSSQFPPSTAGQDSTGNEVTDDLVINETNDLISSGDTEEEFLSIDGGRSERLF